MEGAKVKLIESKSWIGFSSSEPIVLGKVFPTTHVKEEQVQLQHLTSAIETWLFGLQLLHRPRDVEVNPIIKHIILEIALLLKNIEQLSRVIFQDLIDCTEFAREWAPMHTVGSMTDFIECKQRFEKIFQEIHKEMMKVQDERVRREIRRSLPAKEHYGDNFVGLVESSVSKIENRGFVPDFATLHEIQKMTNFFELPANNPDEIEEVEQKNDNQEYMKSIIKRRVRKVSTSKANITHNITNTANSKTEVIEDKNNVVCEEEPHTFNAIEIISPTTSVVSSTISINTLQTAFGDTNIENDREDIPESLTLETADRLEDRITESPKMYKSNLSFRTPVWSLPVDTDVTACTVILVSMVAIMSTLEELVPHMYVYNEFARSRLEEKSSSITDFFMHPSD